ncbi:MAG: MBG domain-containing protein [Oscillospiraceae bacterium]
MKRVIVSVLLIISMLSNMAILTGTAIAVEPEDISISVSQDYNLDIVLTVGDSEKDASTFEAELRAALEARGIPLDEINIQAIETSVTSTNSADASAIFSEWQRYNDTAEDWEYDSTNKWIIKTTNAYWSGFYDPNFDSSDYTLELEMGYATSDNDDMGITFGMTDFPTVSNAGFTTNEHGYAYIFCGGETTTWSTGQQSLTQNSHATGLYEINGNGSSTYLSPLVSNASDTRAQNSWYKFKLVVKGDNAKLYKAPSSGGGYGDYQQIFDYTTADGSDIDGSWGFFANSQPQAAFRNVTMTTNSTKRFAEVIRQPEWGDASQRFIVNLEDGSVGDFSDPVALGEILTRLGNDEIHYIGWGTSANETEATEFVAKNDGRGTFVDNTAADSVDSIADYIYGVYSSTQEADVEYALYGMPNSIAVSPAVEQSETIDEDWPNGKWKVDHDPDCFGNSTGTVPYDGLYLNALDISLTQTGKYDIYYKDTLVKTVYVHRRPVASFDASDDGSGNITLTNNSYDLDSTEGNGIKTSAYSWKETTSDTWTSGAPATLDAGKNYIIKLVVTDNQDVESAPAYKYLSTESDAATLENLKPIAEFRLNPETVCLYNGDGLVAVDDTSYDPAGRAITAEAWTVTKDGSNQGMTPSSNQFDFSSKAAGTYKVSLQVTNEDGILSETAARYITVVDDTEGPTAECDTAAGAYDDATTMTITVSDSGGSGFSRRYVEITDSTEMPETWGNLGTNPYFSVAFSEPSATPLYIHYKLVDNAGNETIGMFGPYTFKFHQTITFDALSDVVYGDAPFSPAATSSSGLGVTYASSDTDVATVDASGTVSIVGAGEATITASQAGDTEYYAAADVQQTFTVAKKPITVTAASGSKVYDGTTGSAGQPTITSGALVTGENGTWSQTYDTKNIGTGKTLTPAGSVSSGGTDTTDNYAVTYVQQAIGEITAATPVITVSDKTALYSGSAVSIAPAAVSGVLPGDTPQGTVSYTYYTDRACSTLTTPSSSGAASNGAAPVYAGVYYVKATIAADGNYTAKTTEAPATLTINEADGSALSIGSDLTKTYGDASFQLTAAGGSGTGAVTYTSSNPAAASVTSGGYVTVRAAGTTTITATKAADGNYTAQTASMAITVNAKTVTYTISNTVRTYTGDVLYASVVPSASELTAGTDYTVTYSKDGVPVAEPREMGTYDIAVATVNTNYAGSASGTLTISSTSQYDIQISGLPDNGIEYGDGFILSANGGSGTGAVSWSSSDDDIATVTDAGEVSVRSVGTVTITATKAADSNYNAQTASVTFTARKKALNITADAENRDYETGNTTVTVSLDTTVADVTASYSAATLLTDHAGTGKVVTVTGVAVDGAESNYYVPASTTIYATVSVLPIDVPDVSVGVRSGADLTVVTALDKTYGDSDFRLAVDSDSTGTVTWRSSDETVARISAGTGVVTITGAGSVTITASQASDGDYNAASADITLDVAPKAVTYTIINNTKSYTGSAQFADVTPSDAGLVEGVDYTVVYSASGTPVESPTAAGTYTIQVETTNDNYTGSSSGAVLTIAAVDQTYTLAIGGLPSRELQYEDTFALYANGGNGTGGIDWSSSDESVATVTSDGTVEICGVGTVTITATKASDNNYNEQDSTVTFHTVKKLLNVSIGGTDKTYSGGVQSVTLTGTATRNHALSAIVEASYVLKADGLASEFKNTGDYTVTLSIASAYDDYYELSDSLPEDATIGKAVLSVTAVAPNIGYGDPEPEVSLDYEGLLGGDTEDDIDDAGFILGTDYTMGDPAGTYGTTIEAGTAEDDNYRFGPLNSSTFTVSNRTLTVTAVADDIEYGDAAPAVTVTYSGFVTGEGVSDLDDTSFTLGTDYTPGDAPGTYHTTIAIGGAADDNYSFEALLTSTFTVEKRAVTVTAGNASKRVGGTDPELTYSITAGTLADENDLDIAVTREAGEDTGSYPITASENTVNTNYDITFVQGTFRIYSGASDPSPSSPSSPSSPPEGDSGNIQLILGDREETTQGTEKTVDGKTVLEVAIGDESPTKTTVMTGGMVSDMQDKDATLEISTGSATYRLPFAQIDLDSIAGQLGSQVDPEDIDVNITIAEPSDDTVTLVEDAANQGGYQLVAEPVDFAITCTSGDASVSVRTFSAYVERLIAIPDGVDPAKITTGVVLNADKTFRHVPTQVTVIDGKYYAKINSLTNSTYSVIYNPVTFDDMTAHWAKDAVNDMGSRLVVTGVGNNLFNPDGSITRAETAAILVRAMGLAQETDESAFDDVSLSDWFNGYIDTASAYGLITGYSAEAFGPGDTITREQAMALIGRAMQHTGLEVGLTDGEAEALLGQYTDGAEVSSYARTDVAALLKCGIVTGSSDTTLSPKDEITRAEIAVMVQRLLQKSELI